MPRSPRLTFVTIKVTHDELAMILHALAATAATFTTAAMIIKGTSPDDFRSVGERYQEFHARLRKAHLN